MFDNILDQTNAGDFYTRMYEELNHRNVLDNQHSPYPDVEHFYRQRSANNPIDTKEVTRSLRELESGSGSRSGSGSGSDGEYVPYKYPTTPKGSSNTEPSNPELEEKLT